MWFLLVTQYVPHPQKVQKNNKTSLGTFKCSLLQRVQKENTKTSLWTFKCNLIQKVQKEISKSSLGTFKCSLGTYDFEMTTPPPHPSRYSVYQNPLKSMIFRKFWIFTNPCFYSIMFLLLLHPTINLPQLSQCQRCVHPCTS